MLADGASKVQTQHLLQHAKESPELPGCVDKVTLQFCFRKGADEVSLSTVHICKTQPACPM